MEGDGDEEDDEGGPGADGEGHSDEDAVEEDAGFEEEALEEESLRVGGGGWMVFSVVGMMTVLGPVAGGRDFAEGDDGSIGHRVQ